MASAAAFHSNLSATPIAAQKVNPCCKVALYLCPQKTSGRLSKTAGVVQSCSGVHGPRCPLSARRSVTAAVLSLIARPIIAPASERVLSGQSGTGLQKRFRLQAMALPTDQPVKVLVTGAGGRTGKLVLKKLLAQPDRFTAKGLVHSVPSLQTVQQETGISKESSFVADIAASSSDIARALQDTDALIIATSAVPKMVCQHDMSNHMQHFEAMQAKLFPASKPAASSATAHHHFTALMWWRHATSVSRLVQVDWIGQKNQIDAAVKAGVKKIVLVSSMGGTDPSNRLNQIGNGNILLFKRKAEEYLMAQGIDYTIIHPGGLIDEQVLAPILSFCDMSQRHADSHQADWSKYEWDAALPV
ncbi:hypothetical protein MMC07_000412 [Pseudocyphellaria aurata]|nr:hypothetical protein [Pseudocyphellaria aurata]